MFGTKMTVAALALVLATSACATHKINYSNPRVSASGQVHEKKQSFFLWGLVGGDEVDLQNTCPNGVARIASQSSAVDGILTVITGGLYSPMSVKVQCAADGVAANGGAS